MASRRQRDEWTELVRRPAAELRGRVVGLIRWLLWGRTPARRDTIISNSSGARSAWPLTRGETAVFGVFLIAACVGVSLTARTPIPTGHATVDEAVLFLKQ